KPIRVVVTGPAGGPTDVAARAVGEGLAETLGPLVFDNRAGASGMLGAEIVSHAAPDGYTLMLSHGGPLGLGPLLAAKAAYDPLVDFAHISLVMSMPMLLIVAPGVAAKTVPELVTLAKAKPGKLNYASGGPGTGIHMAAELFKSVAGVDIVHVPYKGAAPGMTALMSGEVDMMFNGLANTMPFIKSGRVRAVAVSGMKRTPLLPELPTIAESGLPFDYNGWYGLLAPPGMGKPMVMRIHDAVIRALETTATRDRLVALGIDRIGSSPEEFRAHLRNENAKMAKVIAATGMRASGR
ncbi:MAG TPA: tripartite tricarboxylate transporter substrate binding protein, partial [Burkholderiales bacterium]|nr:tripartite tricarboxylate transporter substrate binding protein [Burkholderiales bacterium]